LAFYTGGDKSVIEGEARRWAGGSRSRESRKQQEVREIKLKWPRRGEGQDIDDGWGGSLSQIGSLLEAKAERRERETSGRGTRWRLWEGEGEGGYFSIKDIRGWGDRNCAISGNRVRGGKTGRGDHIIRSL